MLFKNRSEAGKLLAKKLFKYKSRKDVIVLAIPRGGVAIGYEVANYLNAKPDIIVTKKIGLPGNEEFAIGAVGPDKKAIIDKETARIYNIGKAYLKKITEEIGKEIERRYKIYKGKYSLASIKNKTVIIVDDGIATGFTIKSAIQYAKNNNAKNIVVAVPVAPKSFRDKIKDRIDAYICLYEPEQFFAVGEFYDEFKQLSDEDVKRYLGKK